MSDTSKTAKIIKSIKVILFNSTLTVRRCDMCMVNFCDRAIRFLVETLRSVSGESHEITSLMRRLCICRDYPFGSMCIVWRQAGFFTPPWMNASFAVCLSVRLPSAAVRHRSGLLRPARHQSSNRRRLSRVTWRLDDVAWRHRDVTGRCHDNRAVRGRLRCHGRQHRQKGTIWWS